MEKEFELIGKKVVRIRYVNHEQKIKEMEMMTVVGERDRTLKLSNGVTVSKRSLFPYHRKNYHEEEEYFFLEKFIV